MALTFDPRLRPTDDLRGNGPTIYGSYLYPDDLLRAGRRDEAPVVSAEPIIAEILASGVISLAGASSFVLAKRIFANGTVTIYGTLSMQTIAQMQGSGTIRLTGSASGVQRLPNAGTVQVRNQVAGVRIWTESL